MGIEIIRGFFATKEEALDDIKATGFWPTTFRSPASAPGAPELPPHWHDVDIHGYVIEGHTALMGIF